MNPNHRVSGVLGGLSAGQPCEAVPVAPSIHGRAMVAMQSLGEIRDAMMHLAIRAGVNTPHDKNQQIERTNPESLSQVVHELNEMLDDCHRLMTQLNNIA